MRELPLFLLLLVGTFASCSKEVRHTNRIHGTWDIRKLEQVSGNGTVVLSANPDGVMQFDKCQIHEDDFRAFRQLYSYSANGNDVSINETGFYKFIDNGATLIVHIPNDNGHHETRYTVTARSYKKLTMESRQPDGSKTIFELEKR